MNLKMILFDLDGTLLDTSRGIIESIYETIRITSRESIPDAIVQKFIGPPIYDSFKDYYNLNDEESLEMMNVFRSVYSGSHMFDASVYDGIEDLLFKLKNDGFVLGVATNKRDDHAHALLDHFCISDYFDIIRGSDHFNKVSKADIIRGCCKELNVDCNSTVLVGDTDNDSLNAERAGIMFIPVSYGFGYRDVGCSRPLDVYNAIRALK